MKQGKSLVELATEIERQAQSKRDFKLETASLEMHTTKNGDVPVSNLQIHGVGYFGVTPHTHSQIADRLQIPAKFYERLRTQEPDLLDHNVNELFKRNSEPRMVRTLDGNARAFMSHRYRMLDNIDMANNLLPVLIDKQLDVVSCDLTDNKLYIKAVGHRLQAEVKKGDIVEAGVMLSNSEIGKGSVNIQPFLNRLVCTNGAVINELATRKYHVGKELTAGNDLVVYRDKTLELSDQAFWSEMIDVLNAVFTEDIFEGIVNKLRDTTERKITGNPVKVVEVFSTQNGLNQTQSNSVLTHLINGGDLSQWGLMNAVTAMAREDHLDYDEATRMESLGGTVIELSQKDWRVISEAK